MLTTASAIIFTALTAVVFLFQGCLAAGVPWGLASMGGKYPGKYPPSMRVVAIINMLLLSFIAAIVLAEAGLLFQELRAISRIAIWVAVVFFGIATVLNTITPSKIERIWAPVALIQLIAAIIVAIN